MNRMRSAGINDLLKSKKVSCIHLHNHKHPSETFPAARNAKLRPHEGRWETDSKHFCDELERQATCVVAIRMKQHRPFLLVCMGEYAQDWFEVHHASGRFQRELEYEYTLEALTWQIGERPNRYFEAKLFRPNDRSIQATVVALFPNSPAFVAHDIGDDNDCIGKGLRLVGSDCPQ